MKSAESHKQGPRSYGPNNLAAKMVYYSIKYLMPAFRTKVVAEASFNS
jgi:hypothetical protein